MKYNITKEQNTIKVIASVPSRRRADSPVELIDTKKILAILTEEGYNVSDYNTEIETECTNYKPGSITRGEWVFRKKQIINERSQNNEQSAKTTNKVPTKQRTTRKRPSKEN